jgi:hypothetical protein
MKYQKEIDEIFECFYEDWMNDIDKIEFKTLVYQQTGLNDRILNDEIEAGVQKGYGVKYQFDLCKNLLKDSYNHGCAVLLRNKSAGRRDIFCGLQEINYNLNNKLAT